MRRISIFGFPVSYFAVFMVIVLAATYMGMLNNDVVGAVALLCVWGYFFAYIGKKIPVFGSLFGGAVLLPLFGGALLVYFHLIPHQYLNSIHGVMGSGAINIFIGAIIVGSILSMNRKILLSSILRLLPVMLISLVMAVIFILLGCLITRSTIHDGLFMTGIPNFTGGSSGALVVVPTIYHHLVHESLGSLAGRFIVIMNISNVICILYAGVLNKIGKNHPEWTGYGQLMKAAHTNNETDKSQAKADKEKLTMNKGIPMLGRGLLTSIVFLTLGNILATFLPKLNFIAWTSLIVVAAKLIGCINDDLCKSTALWQRFCIKNFLFFLITCVGISSLDLTQLFKYLNWKTLVIVFLAVTGSVLGSMISAKWFGLYPIDAMISIGGNMPSVGGSGAVATLSTAERMNLMAFATIANRIGGALVIVLISLLFPYFA